MLGYDMFLLLYSLLIQCHWPAGYFICLNRRYRK